MYEGSGREVGPVDVYIEMWKSLVELLCMEMGRMMSCAKGIDVCVGSLLSEEISWMTYSVQVRLGVNLPYASLSPKFLSQLSAR